jgi:hypothetical protein
MNILFDNNGFANLVQQSGGAINLQKLKQLVKKRKITVVGCCTMLQELAGLAKINTHLYLDTLSEYEQVTLGQILRPSNELLIAEGKQLKPIKFQASLLDKESARNILNNLKGPSNADAIFSEAEGLKQGYGLTMETTRQGVLSTPSLINEPPSSIVAGYKDWFKHFHVIIQRWFVDMFKVKSDFPVGQLPHVSAFLGYLLTRIYESNVLNIKDRDNDLFDRAYFTDAAVVDILITNDIAFGRTALRVPNRKFEVLKLDELAFLIDKWNTT